jgi:hypothetical protein
MKSLLITSRFPWPSHTGDRLRASIWLSALARDGQVTMVAPSGQVPTGVPPVRVFVAGRSLIRAIQGIWTVLRDRLPFQCLLAAPYDWAGAIANARREAGPFDVTIVLLSRLHPWVRASLEGPAVLDAIDSLRRSAAERGSAASRMTRWLWTAEERRMAQLESSAVLAYGGVVVVSEEETSEFAGAVAVPLGIAVKPLATVPREYDFGFWGRLRYFANADAALWLLDEIWPAIRELQPDASLIIGGADAPRSLRNAAKRRGVALLSPVDDIATFARTIRVALMPVRFGSGQANKVLEAAEAGCAIVGTPQALRGLAPLAKHALIESSAVDLARAAVGLVADEERRTLLAARLREGVARDYARSVTLTRLSAIAAGAEAA